MHLRFVVFCLFAGTGACFGLSWGFFVDKLVGNCKAKLKLTPEGRGGYLFKFLDGLPKFLCGFLLQARCKSDYDSGMCKNKSNNASKTKWYWNGIAKRCMAFGYYGCGPMAVKANRFDSEKDCDNKCGKLVCSRHFFCVCSLGKFMSFAFKTLSAPLKTVETKSEINEELELSQTFETNFLFAGTVIIGSTIAGLGGYLIVKGLMMNGRDYELIQDSNQPLSVI